MEAHQPKGSRTQETKTMEGTFHPKAIASMIQLVPKSKKEQKSI
jgi:hypothetical protein